MLASATRKYIGLAERCGGRLVSLLLKYDNCKINLVNVYAPTNPTKRGIFFQSLVPYLFLNSQLILAGDFNCYDGSLDKMGGRASIDARLTDLKFSTRRLASQAPKRSPVYLV